MTQDTHLEHLELGEIIDSLATCKAEKEDLEAKLSDVKKEIQAHKNEIMARLKESKTESAAGKRLSVRLSSLVVPTVEDWDAFIAWVKREDAWYLLQRRINSTPFRELLAADECPDGLKPFTKEDINTATLG